MQAVRLEAINSLTVREVPAPSPRPGELVVRIEACGVCGSDRHILHGEYPAKPPVTLGHEFAGTVVSSSGDVPLATGTRVAVNPNISCGICRECRRGNVQFCLNLRALGVDRDGGLAEYAVVPMTQAYALSPGTPAEYGALCEPLACCLHGIDVANIRPGMTVAVLGGGVIGQLMVQLARLAGATSVILSTRQPSRRQLAERLGATATIDPGAADVVATVTGTGGLVPDGIDVVLECAGTMETVEQALQLARRGGTVVLFGVAPRSQTTTITPHDVLVRELHIVGAYLNPLTHGRAVELVASGKLDLAPLITHHLALADVPALLASSPQPGEVKAMFTT